MSPVRLVAALLLFVAFALATRLPATSSWDPRITTWLQHAAPALDAPTAVFVFLGNAEVVIPGAFLAGLALAFILHDRARGTKMLWLAAGLACVSVVAVVLKYVIPHPGPPPPLQRPVPWRPGVNFPEPFSFPSGHTMRITFLTGTLLRRVPVAAGALLLAMMAALVYLGDHWAVDVLGGLCLSWACVELARGIEATWLRRPVPRRPPAEHVEAPGARALEAAGRRPERPRTPGP